MTEETPSQKQLAKDVAREMDRRRLRRKILIIGAIVGLIVLAILYLRCGRGWGLGGQGKGDDKAPVATADAGPGRCLVRVDKDGISLDGKPATQAEVVTACKAAGGAEVVVRGDAIQGVWDELRAALDAERVPMYLQKK